MKKQLLISAVSKYIAGLILVAVLLFVPAGSIAYPNGWLFIALLFVPMFFLGLFLLLKAPDLLAKRLNTKEKESAQKKVVGLSALQFLLSFLLAALDFRFGWSHLPPMVVGTASVILLLSYGLYAEVMRENAYLSRTVEVQEGQKLIDTGLYGIVRHPMYTSTILLFLSIPLVLGSLPAFFVMLPYPLLLVQRINNEEALLEASLAGYKEYKRKVKYRLLPFVW
ncbi:MAG: isoprenylcysteine carboxylmethyltransferase family protein [Oscillospiraceae bacterium]|nr:isoprenylcysteine carboxylmethyltransferase family protein [Oscillospiraceae bacterium]